jgi:hypothetical protein
MGRGSRDDRDRDAGPPPQPANSRFAAADHEAERGNREREFAERGPPQQVTNSRFAAAAVDHERESGTQERGDDRGGDRFGHGDERGGDRFGRGDDRGGDRFGRDAGPPPVVNSRFADLVQGDEDYVPAEVRNQRNNERNEDGGGGRFGQQDGGGRFDRQDGVDDRGFGGGGGYNDRGGGGGRYGDNRGGRGGDEMEIPTGPRWNQDSSPVEDAFPPLNKGKVADVLAPKQRREETVLFTPISWTCFIMRIWWLVHRVDQLIIPKII